MVCLNSKTNSLHTEITMAKKSAATHQQQRKDVLNNWHPSYELPEWALAVEEDVYGIIDSKNGWYEAESFEDDVPEEFKALMAKFQLDMILYQTKGLDLWTEKGMRAYTIRCLMFAWLLSPGLLVGPDGKVLTLEKMGKVLGVSKCWLGKVSDAICESFGFFSRNKKSKKARENYANASMEAWKNRTHWTYQHKPDRKLRQDALNDLRIKRLFSIFENGKDLLKGIETKSKAATRKVAKKVANAKKKSLSTKTRA